MSLPEGFVGHCLVVFSLVQVQPHSGEFVDPFVQSEHLSAEVVSLSAVVLWSVDEAVCSYVEVVPRP